MEDEFFPPVTITLDNSAINALQEVMPGKAWDWFKRLRGTNKILGAASVGEAVTLPGLPPLFRLMVSEKAWVIDADEEVSYRVTLSKLSSPR